MTERNKGPMERCYDDVREYLKAKFPDALDSDIQETAAFATNRANVTACDIVRERDEFWCDYLNNIIKASDEHYGRLLDIMRRRE